MKKIIAAILTTALLAALFVLPAGAAFSDVPGSAWYAQDVAAMEKYGILQGTGSGKFSPNGTLTLAQAITIAARTYAYSNGETVPSSGSSVWYDDYLQYAAEKGICALGEFGTNYNNYCNRLTMASLFARVVPEGTDTPLNDVDSLPDVQNNEENQGVFLLYQLGVLTGSNQYGSFNPYQYVKRSETAAIVNRVLNPAERKNFSLVALTPEEYTKSLIAVFGGEWYLDDPNAVMPYVYDPIEIVLTQTGATEIQLDYYFRMYVDTSYITIENVSADFHTLKFEDEYGDVTTLVVDDSGMTIYYDDEETGTHYAR